MIYKDYLILKKKIDEKHKADLAALELLWSSYGAGDSSESQKRSIADNVREVVKALGEPFTVTDVFKGLKDLGCEDIKMPQLSNTMNRLQRKNEIILVASGKGRQPSQYRMAKPGEMNHSDDPILDFDLLDDESDQDDDIPL